MTMKETDTGFGVMGALAIIAGIIFIGGMFVGGLSAPKITTSELSYTSVTVYSKAQGVDGYSVAVSHMELNTQRIWWVDVSSTVYESLEVGDVVELVQVNGAWRFLR